MYPKAHYLAIDGGKSVGWAAFDEKGIDLSFGIVKQSEVPELLKAVAPKVIIYEDFRLRPWMAKKQSWSRMPAPETNGMLKMYAELHGVELVRQDPNFKEIGYKHGNFPKAKSHKNSHGLDARAHGVYYFIKNDIRKICQYFGEC